MLVCLLIIMGLSHYVFPTAYIGYLVGFGLVFLKSAPKIPKLLKGTKIDLVGLFWFVIAIVELINTMLHGWAIDDIRRDFGIILSFVVGRALLFPSNNLIPIIRALKISSKFGNLLIIWILVSAVLAYKDGVSAYLWRGSYIPLMHIWLPFLLVINVGLMRFDTPQRLRYMIQAMFCVVGTLATLSRTDLFLELLFGAALIAIHWRGFLTGRGLVIFTLMVGAAAVILPFYQNLDVVQERVNTGIDPNEDVSLGWRFIEEEALLAFLDEDPIRWIFGLGLGARVPLLYGMVDPFLGKHNIPYLHNSYLTIILKAGLFGLAGFLFYVAKLLLYSRKMKLDSVKALYLVGTWFIVFILGKAMTSQSLTEWSLVFFFGLGACFIARARAANNAIQSG